MKNTKKLQEFSKRLEREACLLEDGGSTISYIQGIVDDITYTLDEMKEEEEIISDISQLEICTGCDMKGLEVCISHCCEPEIKAYKEGYNAI